MSSAAEHTFEKKGKYGSIAGYETPWYCHLTIFLYEKNF